MKRVLIGISSAVLLTSAALAQSTEPLPKFDAADIHPSEPSPRAYMSGPFIHGLRYELKNAALVDLIRIAYDFDPDKITGGPSWVEFDRFDIVGKTPAGASLENMKLMLQSLLVDRFGLTVHKDTKPFPAFSLTAKAPKLKESDGTSSDMPGCGFRSQMPPPPPPPPGGGGAVVMPPTEMTLTATCHNSTLTAFANSLRGLMFMGGGTGMPAQVVDHTGLTGHYDIEFKFTIMRTAGPMDPGPGVIDAIDKQLGLNLEKVTAPMPVLVVDKANRKPTANAPDIAKILPTLPTEFDVVEIKPNTDSNTQSIMMNGMPMAIRTARGGGGGMQIVQPFQNDRVNLTGQTLKNLIYLAYNIYSDDQVVGAPKFVDGDKWDVIGKTPPGLSAPSSATTAGGRGGIAMGDTDAYRPMLRALLAERFKLTAHYEDKTANGYVLTAAKPKLQKADPANHTKCTEGPGPDGKDPRKTNPAVSRLLYCQNMTMAEFASIIPGQTGYVSTLVDDSTGLEGAYDFTLSFSNSGVMNGGGRGQMVFMGGGGGGMVMAGPAGGGGDAGGSASDPSGGITLFDALQKQLGLKLEMQKHTMKVLVIDHIEPKPTEN